MTDTTFLPVASEEGTSDNRRNLVLLGALGAVVLAGAGYYFLLGGSSSSDTTSFTAAPVVRHRAAAPAAAKPAAKPAVKPAVLPATSTVPIGRNPFKALYVPPAAAPAAPAGTTSGTTTTTTSSTSTGATSGTTTVAPYKMTLLAVKLGTNGTAPQYTFSFLGTTKTVIAAQRFGTGGHVVVLAYTRSSTGAVTGALVQVGDSDPIPVSIKGSFMAS